MRHILNISGAVLMLLGAIWILQGTNLLPGSFMTGQIQWAVYGAFASAVGLGMLFAAWRLRTRPRDR